MAQIVGIRKVERPIYDEIFLSGDKERTVKAPILGFYELSFKGPSANFLAEVRLRPHPESSAEEYAEQVDWYEDLDDYLFQIGSRAEANRLRELISMSIYSLRGVILIGTEIELPQWGKFVMSGSNKWKLA